MRKYLLPEKGNFYKVNMHSHSTLSDGLFSPEELKEIYMSKGYSAIAFTEHGWNYDVNYLTDENFVAIRAYEYDVLDPNGTCFELYEGPALAPDHREMVHLNLYAKTPDNDRVVCVAPGRIPKKHPELINMDQIMGTDNYPEQYSINSFNRVIKTANENGFLVVYNHPHWSLNNFELYSKLKGLHGLEIVNGASHRSSDMDFVPHVYDQMSRAGQRLICVGGDDNHRPHHVGIAWTMVKADKLDYESLIKAIENGDCYASTGPEIKELYVEDGVVTVRCSEAVGVFMTTIGRRKPYKVMDEGGEYITEVQLKLAPTDIYFRITVKDERGNRATSRVYYLDEFGM